MNKSITLALIATLSVGLRLHETQTTDKPSFTTFTYHSQRLNRDEAQAACEYRGGSLAVITSQEQNDQVMQQFRLENHDIWIGMTDQAEEGTFV